MNVPIQELLNTLSLGKFYSYNGGLTTPPCTEGVNWTVLSEPVPISASVANSIKSRY
jgi:carbonic anhydrase